MMTITMNKKNASETIDTRKIETRNRRLEQFLYLHDIMYTTFHKDNDGMTVWEYPDTKEVRVVVAEFREIQAKRAAKAK